MDDWSAGKSMTRKLAGNKSGTKPVFAMAERRDATGIDVIRGLVLSRIGANARSCDPLVTRDDWFGALADIFHLRFEHSPPGTRDRLWSRVVERHHAWEAGGCQ